jgi:hypothetical protein
MATLGVLIASRSSEAVGVLFSVIWENPVLVRER